MGSLPAEKRAQDTYGRARCFKCAGNDGSGRPVFTEPVMILQGGSRLSVLATDWDSDGAPDVLVVRGGDVQWLRNRAHAGTIEFEKPVRLRIPPCAGTFDSVATVDLNGDGDEDLVYQTSARLTCWVERSFMLHGYRVATLLEASARD